MVLLYYQKNNLNNIDLETRPGLQSERMTLQKTRFWYDISVDQGFEIDRESNVQIVARNLRALQRGLTGDRTRIASRYMDERSSLQAYLLYYWAISLYESTLILAELRARRQLSAIRSVLDIGSGPGPASFAANIFGAQKAFLVDKSEKALTVAQNIAAEGRKHENKNAPSKTSFEIIAQRAELEEFRPPRGETFDLIVASHSLNELWHGAADWLERRRDFLLRLLPALRPGGVLLIVEPSAHYTSIPLLALRDALLSSAQTQESALDCVGPCPHSTSCPMRSLGARPCFSEWPWASAPPLITELAHRAGLDRSLLKAAWVAFKKDGRNTAPPQAIHNCIRGRIVSEPLRNKAGRIRYIVCTDTGLLKTISAAQDDNARSLGFFQLARGDLIEAEGLDERGQTHLGLVQGTRMQVLMKAPRI
jgi:ribosomal protein RSM22 (predicted rRNA methylase)